MARYFKTPGEHHHLVVANSFMDIPKMVIVWLVP